MPTITVSDSTSPTTFTDSSQASTGVMRDANQDISTRRFLGTGTGCGVRSGGHLYVGTSAQTVNFSVNEVANNGGFYPVDATGAQVTATLEAVSGKSGKTLEFVKTDSTTNPVLLDGNSSELVGGALIFPLYRQYDRCRIVCDGSAWHVLSSPRVLAAATAASSAIANSTSNTAFDNISLTLAANTIRAGEVLHFRGQGIVTAQTGADTFTVTLNLGSTAIVTTGAVDPATSDLFYFDVTVEFRTIGASGTMVATGVVAFGVPGTVTAKPFLMASTVVDTTATIAVTVKGQWSAMTASDSARLDTFVAERLTA